MRILFVADGRSPTALNWISYFVEQGDEVHLASMFPCEPDLKMESLTMVPAVFSGAAGLGGGPATRSIKRLAGAGLRTRVRQLLGPMMLKRGAGVLRNLIEEVQPDMVHAMRIPFEGMLAAKALEGVGIPLVVSVWGNDFTLHAASSRRMAKETRQVMRRADGLHTDTQRDKELANEWSFGPGKESVVLPGGGGIRSALFYPPETPPKEAVVINPRGLRAYIRNDTFFAAIPLVLAEMPEARFVCPAMAGEAEAEMWVEKYGLGEAVELLPMQSRAQMGELFRRSQVVASISEHDGTPNTLLEAMACGCFPVAGDIESLREWLRDGENGLLVDPGSIQELAEAMLKGLRDSGLRETAATANEALVAERAEFDQVMARAAVFYKQFYKESM